MNRPVQKFTQDILEYWFGTLDDRSTLDQTTEPFRTHYQRWYGKDPTIDDHIRKTFEPTLELVTRDGRDWEQAVESWASTEKGLLALTILLDQFPRNMYRDSARMYAFDSLALMVTSQAIRSYEKTSLALVERMFLYLPLMHAENVTLQQAMMARFEQLVEWSAVQSPQNRGFFEYGLGYARRHLEIVQRFGRFPHRNAILGRSTSAEEASFLTQAGSSF